MTNIDERPYQLFDVHVKAFPLNLQTQPANWSEAADAELSNALPVPGIVFRQAYFESLVYNETPTFVADIPEQGMRDNCETSTIAAIESEYGYSVAGARFYFTHTGCVIAMFALKAPDDVLEVSGEELRNRGVTYFRSTCPMAGLLYDIIEVMFDAKLLTSTTPATYDLFEQRDKETFMEEMEWRAWSSSSHIALGPDVSSLTWPTVSGYEGTAWIRNDNPSVSPIDNNYLGWKYVCENAETTLSDIFALLEPIGFTMSQRSICSSGLHNMRTIANRFAYDQPMQMPVDDLRRYVALVRTNLMSCQTYEESSEKGARQVYSFMMTELNMSEQTRRLEQAMDAVSASITGMEAAHEERFQRRVSLAVIVFTCLTIISVAADVSAFVDMRANILSVSDRIKIVLVSLGISLVTVLGLWGILGRKNPLHHTFLSRPHSRSSKLNNKSRGK